jgi:hypothetical protein
MGEEQNPTEGQVYERPSLMRRIRRFVFRFCIVLLILVAIMGYEVGRWSVYAAHPELGSTEQADAILKKVGALIQLPSGEVPNMATITDAATIKQSQPFLANAENGDVLIVYAVAKTALLYRPSSNKIISVGPVSSSVGTEQGIEQLPNTSQQSVSTTTIKNAPVTTPKK